MSLYGNKMKIDGIPCGVITRGIRNGEYKAIFEREFAGLEQIETINWRRPKLSGPCELPAGYGFDVKNIDYLMSEKAWAVTLKVREQYLGDVTGYQAQVAELAADKARLEADKERLETDNIKLETSVAQLEEDKARLTANSADKDAAIESLKDQLAEADETAIALYEDLQAARRLGYETEESEAEPEQAENPGGEEAKA